LLECLHRFATAADTHPGHRRHEHQITTITLGTELAHSRLHTPDRSIEIDSNHSADFFRRVISDAAEEPDSCTHHHAVKTVKVCNGAADHRLSRSWIGNIPADRDEITGGSRMEFGQCRLINVLGDHSGTGS
jgi:hypothetical protein